MGDGESHGQKVRDKAELLFRLNDEYWGSNPTIWNSADGIDPDNDGIVIIKGQVIVPQIEAKAHYKDID